MTLILLIVAPLAWAAVLAAVPSNRWRPWLLPIGSAAHLGLTAQALQFTQVGVEGYWLVLDPLRKIFLGCIRFLDLPCMTYAPR